MFFKYFLQEVKIPIKKEEEEEEEEENNESCSTQSNKGEEDELNAEHKESKQNNENSESVLNQLVPDPEPSEHDNINVLDTINGKIYKKPPIQNVFQAIIDKVIDGQKLDDDAIQNILEELIIRHFYLK